ncbi:hypothetical protein [Sphingomonas hengshuiensis]|uniref:hypothetical protein n=1 Tax=Sphingomonas hengshuiensis TaxID=1609977 RepID=UPI000A47064A|nr:hypothetical protein [Sphingomonas hengshuiensis]
MTLGFLLGSVLAAFALTTLAAWLLVSRWPRGSAHAQAMGAALSFPVCAVALFAVATAVTLGGGGDAAARQGAGMVVFALVFFLVYALVIGVVVGLPTAFLMVRRFRRG